MARGIAGTAKATPESIRAALSAHGSLMKAGKALGIGRQVYQYASRYGIKSPLGDPKKMSQHKQTVSRQRVLELSAQGLELVAIAEQLGCHRTTVMRVLAQRTP